MLKNHTTQSIPALLILSMLLPAILFMIPNKVSAVWGVGDVGTDPPVAATTGASAVSNASSAASQLSLLGYKIKDVAQELLKQILKTVAKRVLAEMTKSTINWINGGFHGAPLFLENPDSFFKDIAKSEVRRIVDMIGYDTFRFPFGPQTALNVIDSYKATLEGNAQYTLSKVINDPDLLAQYRNDFNFGGWNGFLINTQYPQNNYLGFQMIIRQNLASRLEGTLVAPANKIKDLLQQGQGFLSPQTCPSNPNYNNATNEFVKPTFKPSIKFEPPVQDSYESAVAAQAERDAYVADYNARLAVEKANWEKLNTCPGGLVNTTPGSVASAQIASALNAPFLTTALDGALGNSLSAIFDALLNKFLSDGLNALASEINPSADLGEEWSYNGQTLGSPTVAGTNATWDSGPDVPIELGKFKNQINGYDSGTCSVRTSFSNIRENVSKEECDLEGGSWVKTGHRPGDIDNTKTELKLMYNESGSDPGIYQMLGKIWPKARELDKCIPGPDVINLQKRLDGEVSRINKKIQNVANGGAFGGSDKTEDADLIIRELTSAVKFFQGWITDQMMTALPSSVIYMDAVNDVKTFSDKADQLTDRRRVKSRALARLEAIKANLDTITTQPATGSPQEKTLVSLWKQYQAALVDVSNAFTIEDTRNELSTVKDSYTNLVDLATSCPVERALKGWSNPGGANASLAGRTEQALFCSLPITGGYSHKTFINLSGVTYPEIPLINAQNVMKYKSITLLSVLRALDPVQGFNGFNVTQDASFNVRLNCGTIFNASLGDYKGNLPGVIPSTAILEDISAEEILGNCKRRNGTVETDYTQQQCSLIAGATWTIAAPEGTCTAPVPNTTPVQTISVPNTTEADCSKADGSWAPN